MLSKQRNWVVFIFTLVALGASETSSRSYARAEENDRRAPTLKFFYYDSANIEWVVSEEMEPFDSHLQENADSARLFQTLSTSVSEQPDLEQVRVQMARWLEQERGRATTTRGNVVRLRKAEGIGAYLRAHEFSMDQLVRALLKHSGASSVEIAAVHLVDVDGTPTFQLKVLLPQETIGIGGQGFNVVFRSPETTYTGVVYALAVALYEVHEIINFDANEGAGTPPGVEIETLPPPEPAGPSGGDTQQLRTTAVRPS